MKLLPIKIYGEEVLRQTATDVENIDGELVGFMDSLVNTLKNANGLGLAANQVGLSKRIYAVDMSYFDVVKAPLVLINPVVQELSGSAKAEEGCLSFPGLYFEVDRPERAVVTGLDRNGKEIIVEGTGLVARVLLHELDHLNGKLYIDHLSSLQRGLLKGKLKRIMGGERV
jgi:peptide deformylase